MSRYPAPYPDYQLALVDWIGKVPAHWTVASLKRGYDVKLGKMLQTKPINSVDELLPYMRAANIQWEGVDTTDVKEMWISKSEQVALRLKIGRPTR